MRLFFFFFLYKCTEKPGMELGFQDWGGGYKKMHLMKSFQNINTCKLKNKYIDFVKVLNFSTGMIRKENYSIYTSDLSYI